MRTDRRTAGETDMMKLLVVFRNFATSPKRLIISWSCIRGIVSFTIFFLQCANFLGGSQCFSFLRPYKMLHFVELPFGTKFLSFDFPYEFIYFTELPGGLFFSWLRKFFFPRFRRSLSTSHVVWLALLCTSFRCRTRHIISNSFKQHKVYS
jgi:hypothetical protein